MWRKPLGAACTHTHVAVPIGMAFGRYQPLVAAWRAGNLSLESFPTFMGFTFLSEKEISQKLPVKEHNTSK